MKTIALWLEFRFNLFLVPFEDFGNTKLSFWHLRTSFNEIQPPPHPHPPPTPTPPPHNKNMAHIAMSAV